MFFHKYNCFGHILEKRLSSGNADVCCISWGVPPGVILRYEIKFYEIEHKERFFSFLEKPSGFPVGVVGRPSLKRVRRSLLWMV